MDNKSALILFEEHFGNLKYPRDNRGLECVNKYGHKNFLNLCQL